MPEQQQEQVNIHYPRLVHLSPHTALTWKTIRTSDNPFPIQEEPEDDHDQRNDWLSSQNESVRRSSSPTLSQTSTNGHTVKKPSVIHRTGETVKINTAQKTTPLLGRA